MYYQNTPTSVLQQLESSIQSLLFIAGGVDWFERPLWLDDLEIELLDLQSELHARCHAVEPVGTVGTQRAASASPRPEGEGPGGEG